jgi:hypothetical protein
MKVECADGDVEQGSNTHQGSKPYGGGAKQIPVKESPAP